jgi:type I site-specific restriction endonuclease
VADVLELPDEILPTTTDPEPTEQLLIAAERPYKVLKDYQTPVYHEAIQRLTVERRRFIVQMPTGSGKTRTATEIVTTFLNESPPGTIVFWLAHAEELCEQAYEAFRDVWPHVARVPVRLVRCWGKGAKLPRPDENSAFVIGSFQTLYAALTKQTAGFAALRERITLVVIDEAHKVLAPTYKEVTEALLGETTKVVGLTATPGRGADDEEQNAALANFFFGEMVTIASGDVSVIDYLRAKRVLSETTYVPLLTAQSYALSTKEKIHLESFFDLPAGVLKRLRQLRGGRSSFLGAAWNTPNSSAHSSRSSASGRLMWTAPHPNRSVPRSLTTSKNRASKSFATMASFPPDSMHQRRTWSSSAGRPGRSCSIAR